jgi:hypothetical protein
MDSVTMIRVVAGVLAVVLIVVMVARRKRMAASRQLNTRK